MARRSKEINIFSMSALDLFASALGAFILLTVIMLPYFPNTGDSPALIEGIKGELTAAEAELVAAEQAKAEAEAERDAAAEAQAKAEADAAAAQTRAEQAEAARDRAEAAIPVPTPSPSGGRRLPPLDVVIAIDTTGSMGAQVDGMKRDIESMMSILQELSDDAAIGIIDFKDRCYGSLGMRSYSLRKITSSMTSGVRRFVQQMSVGAPSGVPASLRRCNQGASSGPELIDGALREAINQNWRSSSPLRMIIIVTDNTAYADKVEQTYSDAAAFSGRGGEVSVVFASSRGEPSAIPYLRTLAERGGGDFVSGASFIGTVLVALLR